MALFHIHGTPVSSVAILLALVASIGGFIFGYDTGQISDILLMDDFLLRFAQCGTPGDVSTCEFSVVRSGLIVALLSIGTLVGALVGAPIADFLGRRWAMITECALFSVGVIVQIAAVSEWSQFAVGRLISGLGIGALSCAVPVYQAETAPPNLRGTLTATYQLFITFGILVAYCISIGTRGIDGPGQWRVVVGLGLIWPALLSFGILFMPESPRWLAAHGKIEAAKHSLARSAGVKRGDVAAEQYVQNELDEIVASVEHERRVKGGWVDCFRPRRKVLYRTLLGMGLQSFQQLTGANYFFYYGATIFRSVGINDSFITQIILGAVNFGCTFGGLYVMERFGRRMPLIVGGLWQAAWLFVFASAGTARVPEDNPNIGKLMIVSACLFILGFATTWAPGVWILIGETFPMKTRAKQSALATASNWTWNFLIAFFTPFIDRAIRFRYGYVFAACNLAAALMVFFFLYESSNLTLESVDDMYNDPNCKPWTSRHWVPSGYATRTDFINHKKEKRGDVQAALRAANGLTNDEEKSSVQAIERNKNSTSGRTSGSLTEPQNRESKGLEGSDSTLAEAGDADAAPNPSSAGAQG
ncbi:hypothetical protein AX16_002108 [Volvariella volvacea WC 439]|nr:hypothetical protein AX16_002108 [Volvariella volvacea WC 439]